MTQADVIAALWAQIEADAYITREAFVRGVADWEIEPVLIAGRLAFAALTNGPEFHFASFGTGAAISRGMIRQRLAPIIERHGFVTTRTPRTGADRQHRINRALGFVATGGDEFFTLYRLDGAKCR